MKFNFVQDSNVKYMQQAHNSAVTTGGQGGLVTAVCAPYGSSCPRFGFSKYFFGTSRNDKTTDNNGKRINNVQNNSSLPFFRFVSKLQVTNCCVLHKCETAIRLIDTPLRLRREIGM